MWNILGRMCEASTDSYGIARSNLERLQESSRCGKGETPLGEIDEE
jgi:hypothetical protein